ncbi:hypothetical protein BH11VER1_BH11VER1_31830 [soil metagenome]
MSLSIALSPQGHLIADELAEESGAFTEGHGIVAREALIQGDGATLLWLASFKSTQSLPLAALFWRDFAGRLLTKFCHGGGTTTESLSVEESTAIIEQVPPMRGTEYLTVETLQTLWLRFETHLLDLVSRHPEGRDGWLRAHLPHWHLVGRVTLHLAENKKDLERPFAFLATYTSGLNAEGKPRHLPLQQAIKEYAGTANKKMLLHLLEPLSLAAEKSEWAKGMVDSGAIYRPQAWIPSQALSFLREVLVFEACGLAVRIPDWWKPSAPPRPQVTVAVGGDAPSSFGVGSLLSFKIEVTLNGEKLSPEELKALKTAEGLVLLKGKWVEVDAEKLQAVLDHWRSAQRLHFGEGLSFLQAMRLLSGAGIDGPEATLLTDDVQAWTGIEPGPWLEKLLKELRDPSCLDAVGQPSDLKATLRPYQSIGANWLHFMVRLGLGACLADDMGLGKTIQLLALLLHLKREESARVPSLLIAPASLLANWKSEAAGFAPGLRIFIAHPSGGEPERLSAFGKGKEDALENVDLVVTSYGMIPRMEAFKTQAWRLAVLDEAQTIKNPDAAQTKAVKKIQAQSRIALTGTPVENKLADLWSIFDFINPGLLGTGGAFGRFVKSMGQGHQLNWGPLRRLVRPYILRRLKTDKTIISDLPDKSELNAWCLLTKPQAILYQRVVDQLAKDLAETKGMQKKGIILGALMAFKQICNHPAQYSGDAHYDAVQSGKFIRLRELCQPIAERQERVLIFTQFTEIIPALRDFMKGIFGREGLVLTGQTPIKQRRVLVEEFQSEGGPPFFILSLKAGGTGLTLTAASHVVHFDRWWNPAVENQATDRAYRIGQKKNVLVHKFVCRGTLEERIDRTIADKKGLSDSVLAEGDELPLTEMSDADLLSFVALDVNQISSHG